MKYTFTITGESREKLILESRADESPRHIVLKIMGYLLFCDSVAGSPLRIEQGVEQRHKPDLVATEPGTDQVRLWIDCGQIEPKRLERIVTANRKAHVVVIKSTVGEMEAYIRAASRTLPPKDRRAHVTYIGFDEEFIDDAAEALRGTNDVAIDQTEDGTLSLTLNGETLTTMVHRQED